MPGLGPWRATCSPLPCVRSLSASSQVRQHEFREKFREEAPFTFMDPDPYQSLNKVMLREGRVWGQIVLHTALQR